MIQIPWEIRSLARLLSLRPPERMLEIGNGTGETLSFLAKVCAPEATILGMDIARPQNVTVGPAQRLHLLQADSHAKAAVESVRDLLQGRQLDFLFIDGDHSGVEADFDAFRGLVRPDGIIALHDIVPGMRADVGVVPEFWQKIRQEFSGLEMVANWKQGGYGIGVIFPPL